MIVRVRHIDNRWSVHVRGGGGGGCLDRACRKQDITSTVYFTAEIMFLFTAHWHLHRPLSQNSLLNSVVFPSGHLLCACHLFFILRHLYSRHQPMHLHEVNSPDIVLLFSHMGSLWRYPKCFWQPPSKHVRECPEQLTQTFAFPLSAPPDHFRRAQCTSEKQLKIHESGLDNAELCLEISCVAHCRAPPEWGSCLMS